MALHTEPRDIFEAAARQRVIKVVCSPCGHEFRFDPHELWWHFERKGWDQWLNRIAWRFRCTSCGARKARIELTSGASTRSAMPLPGAYEWKRAINRYRA